MQLIDADSTDLQDAIGRNAFKTKDDIRNLIDAQLTIDAEPVRHGRIIEFWDDTYHPRRKFSCCGTDCTTLTLWVWPKYCPYCGAKLNGKAKEENNGL